MTRFERVGAAMLALLLAGCGDDGVSPLSPAAGLAGTWVAAAGPGQEHLRIAVPADTLFIDRDLRTTWSRELRLAGGGSDRLRLDSRVRERDGILTLAPWECDDVLIADCAAPQTEGGVAVTGPFATHWIQRDAGRDWIAVVNPLSSFGSGQWYRRAGAPRR